MTVRDDFDDRRNEPSGPGTAAWRLVFSREFFDLWIGGRALTLTLLYSILLGVLTYIFASNRELSLIPPKEMVYETLKGAIAVALLISLIIGADSLSGERERATLEGLLLTPASRRQIVVGKFLAAISPWPATLLIAVPYMSVLAQGDEVFGKAVLWGAVFGSLLVPAFSAVGMIVSFWSNTIKTSMLVSLGIYLLFLLPTQLPGPAQTGAPGRFLQWVNPMQAPNFFLAKILVNNRTFSELWIWLITPVVFAILAVGLLFVTASRLRLEAGMATQFGAYLHRVAGLSAIVALLLSLAIVPVMAQEEAPEAKEASSAGQGITEANIESLPLQISIDLRARTVKAGDPVEYRTAITNQGTEPSLPLTVAMNIINLNAAGDVVDPEDWSPQRTQYIDRLEPGQSAELSWRVNAIFDGDYMVYMVVVPKPGGPEATSQPVASPGIHLTVTPFTRLNPGGVLPYAIGIPLALMVGTIILLRHRRRTIDMGQL